MDLLNSLESSLESLTLTRLICSIISIVSCLIIIILYIISILHMTFKKKKNDDSKNESSASVENKSGLGSHYMFLLVLSNLLSSLIEGSFYIVLFIFDKNENKDKNYYKIFSISSYCQWYSFLHNFFELNGVCWTTFIVRLFYYSSKLVKLGSHKKQMIQSSIISLSCSLIISILPFIFGCYGFAYTHCSFNKIDDKKKLISLIFGTILTIFIIGNCFWNVVNLMKSHDYYKNKILQLKDQNENEYKTLKIYVILFKLFPFFLIFSRGIKLVQFFVEKTRDHILIIIVTYINSILYCLTGFFDSLFCFFFFKGVYKSCCKSEDDNSMVKDNINDSILYEDD